MAFTMSKSHRSREPIREGLPLNSLFTSSTAGGRKAKLKVGPLLALISNIIIAVIRNRIQVKLCAVIILRRIGNKIAQQNTRNIGIAKFY